MLVSWLAGAWERRAEELLLLRSSLGMGAGSGSVPTSGLTCPAPPSLALHRRLPVIFLCLFSLLEAELSVFFPGLRCFRAVEGCVYY